MTPEEKGKYLVEEMKKAVVVVHMIARKLPLFVAIK